MKILRKNTSKHVRVLICMMIILVIFPSSIISAYSEEEIKERLTLKLALDTDHNGLDIADIVRYIIAVDEPIEREDILKWMGMIDPAQHVDLESFLDMYDTADGLLWQSNQGSEEAYTNMGNTYQAASTILDQPGLKQRQVDEHTLALAEAIIAYKQSTKPLEFTEPEFDYIDSLGSYRYYYYQATGGLSPYSFEYVGTLPTELTFYPGSSEAAVGWDFGIADGDYSFTLRVTDAMGRQVTQTFTLRAIKHLRIHDLTVLPGIGQADFEFSAPIAASHIEMQQSSDNGATWHVVPEERISALDTTSTSAVVTGLDNDVTYQFRLEVTDGVNAGTSNVVAVQPSNLIAISSDSSVTLHFEPQANLTIQQSDTGGLYWTDLNDLQINPETKSVTISGLTNGKVYMYRLQLNGDTYSNEVIAVPVMPFSDYNGYAMRTPDSVIVAFDPQIGFTKFYFDIGNHDPNRIDATLGMPIYHNSTFAQLVDLPSQDNYKIAGGYGIGLYPAIAQVEPLVRLSPVADNGVVTISYIGFPTFNKTGRLQRLQDGQEEWEDIGIVTDSTPFIDDTIISEGLYHYRMLITSPTYFELSETSSVVVELP